MGAVWSSGIPQAEPEKYIIVPPIIAMDRQGRNRMCYSSYDWLFSKRELTHLMGCFMQPGPSACIHLSPPADRRFLVSTKINSRDASQLDGAALRRALKDCTGGLSIRFQGDKNNPLSFTELNVNYQAGSVPSLRSAYVNPMYGYGWFTSIPLTEGAQTDATTGVRYARPNFSMGMMSYHSSRTLDQVWIVGKHGPITAGLQLEPIISIQDVINDPQSLAKVDPCPSACLQYRPCGQSPYSDFSSTIEIDQAKMLRVSVYQHLAVVRRVYNLFEDDDVIGISNYLDLGVIVETPLVGDRATVQKGSVLRTTAAWQVNSNVVVKARAGTDKIAAAVAFKSWWNPSFTFSLTGGWDFQKARPCLGVALLMDNDSELRYERGKQMTPTGSLVKQRHIATGDEEHIGEGYRPIIRSEDDGSAHSVVDDIAGRPVVDLL